MILKKITLNPSARGIEIYKNMKHLLEYDSYNNGGNPYANNPSDYKTLTPGQISHYRQVFNMNVVKNDYVLKILNTIEKKGGKCSLKQWNVIQHYYNGDSRWPVNY